MTVSWLQPPRALSWRATARAVVLASITMLSPSWTSAAAAAPMRAFSSAWSRSRMSNASSGRLRSMAIAPPWVRTSRVLRLEHDEVLADGDRGDAEPGGEVGDPGATVLLDDPGDVLLALPGEDVARRGVGGIVTALLPVAADAGHDRGFRLVSGTVIATGTQCQESN